MTRSGPRNGHVHPGLVAPPGARGPVGVLGCARGPRLGQARGGVVRGALPSRASTLLTDSWQDEEGLGPNTRWPGPGELNSLLAVPHSSFE